MMSFRQFLNEFTFNPLKLSDLTKRGGDRIDVFTSKIDNGEPFLTPRGEVILDKKQKIDDKEVTTKDLNKMMRTVRGF